MIPWTFFDDPKSNRQLIVLFKECGTGDPNASEVSPAFILERTESVDQLVCRVYRVIMVTDKFRITLPWQSCFIRKEDRDDQSWDIPVLTSTSVSAKGCSLCCPVSTSSRLMLLLGCLALFRTRLP